MFTGQLFRQTERSHLSLADVGRFRIVFDGEGDGVDDGLGGMRPHVAEPKTTGSNVRLLEGGHSTLVKVVAE